jgi:RecB family exonuclease
MAYRFPEKIFPSALNTYIQCPFKFSCQNNKEIKAEFVDTPENFVGKVIHSVLKDLFDIGKTPIDRRKEQDVGKMVRLSWARMPKNNYSNEYWSGEDRKQLFGSIDQEKACGLNAIAMLSNYIATADLSVIPLHLEDWMQCRIGNFVIAGRIDRIDQESNSLISVWDYKTGKLPFYDNAKEMVEKDYQLPIYAVIASKMNPFAENIKAGLIFLKYSKKFEIIWNKEELQKIENKVIAAIEEVRNDNNFIPRINSLCPWCEYKTRCPLKDKIQNKNQTVEEVGW